MHKTFWHSLMISKKLSYIYCTKKVITFYITIGPAHLLYFFFFFTKKVFQIQIITFVFLNYAHTFFVG